MKKGIVFCGGLIMMMQTYTLSAQPFTSGNPVVPYKSDMSVLFGKDIVIHDKPERDQRNVVICSSFNGWLYAAYHYRKQGMIYIAILKSVDNGSTWNAYIDDPTYVNRCRVTRMSIISGGNSLNEIKVFFGWIYYDTVLNIHRASIYRFNGITLASEGEILMDFSNIHDLSLSSDYMYPATNSNPFSIAVLYSMSTQFKDSLIFKSSSNGGMSFNTRHAIASTSYYLGDVALAYGRSASWNEGRYFAVWEDKLEQNASTGHIYTAHSLSGFNSSFTPKICLDSLDPSLINNCRNPVIACQYSNFNNDSANLTEMILFEKFIAGQNSHDIGGFYNLKAASGSSFHQFDLSSAGTNMTQPDLNFNPYDSTFMVTCFDSSSLKLPLLTNNVNLPDPDIWNIISPGYNDSTNIISPFPKVVVDHEKQSGANVWTSFSQGGNGRALFDAVFNTYTGIIGQLIPYLFHVHVYPNPCNDYVIFDLELNKPIAARIKLYDILSKSLQITYEEGQFVEKKRIRISLIDIPAGIYIYEITAGNDTMNGKLIIIK